MFNSMRGYRTMQKDHHPFKAMLKNQEKLVLYVAVKVGVMRLEPW